MAKKTRSRSEACKNARSTMMIPELLAVANFRVLPMKTENSHWNERFRRSRISLTRRICSGVVLSFEAWRIWLCDHDRISKRMLTQEEILFTRSPPLRKLIIALYRHNGTR